MSIARKLLEGLEKGSRKHKLTEHKDFPGIKEIPCTRIQKLKKTGDNELTSNIKEFVKNQNVSLFLLKNYLGDDRGFVIALDQDKIKVGDEYLFVNANKPTFTAFGNYKIDKFNSLRTVAKKIETFEAILSLVKDRNELTITSNALELANSALQDSTKDVNPKDDTTYFIVQVGDGRTNYLVYGVEENRKEAIKTAKRSADRVGESKFTNYYSIGKTKYATSYQSFIKELNSIAKSLKISVNPPSEQKIIEDMYETSYYVAS